MLLKDRLHNRYYAKTMRNTVKKLRATTDKAEAVAMYPGIQKMLDKLANIPEPQCSHPVEWLYDWDYIKEHTITVK